MRSQALVFTAARTAARTAAAAAAATTNARRCASERDRELLVVDPSSVHVRIDETDQLVDRSAAELEQGGLPSERPRGRGVLRRIHGVLHRDPFHFATELGSRQHHPSIAVAPRDASTRSRDVGDEAADPHLLWCRGMLSELPTLVLSTNERPNVKGTHMTTNVSNILEFVKGFIFGDSESDYRVPLPVPHSPHLPRGADRTLSVAVPTRSQGQLARGPPTARAPVVCPRRPAVVGRKKYDTCRFVA